MFDDVKILQVSSALVIALATLILYYFWIGKSNHSRRKDLEKKLAQVSSNFPFLCPFHEMHARQAQEMVHDLEGKLFLLEESDLTEKKKGKEIRIWMVSMIAI